MSTQLAKQIEKSGTKMTKNKLLELIRKSAAREFNFLQAPGSKHTVFAVE